MRNRGSRGGRVGQEVLERLSLLKGVVVQVDGDGHQGAEGVADGVGQGSRLGRVADLQGDSGDLGQGHGEHAGEVSDGHENGHGEERAVVEQDVDGQTVRERSDAELWSFKFILSILCICPRKICVNCL